MRSRPRSYQKGTPSKTGSLNDIRLALREKLLGALGSVQGAFPTTHGTGPRADLDLHRQTAQDLTTKLLGLGVPPELAMVLVNAGGLANESASALTNSVLPSLINLAGGGRLSSAPLLKAHPLIGDAGFDPSDILANQEGIDQAIALSPRSLGTAPVKGFQAGTFGEGGVRPAAFGGSPLLFGGGPAGLPPVFPGGTAGIPNAVPFPAGSPAQIGGEIHRLSGFDPSTFVGPGANVLQQFATGQRGPLTGTGVATLDQLLGTGAVTDVAPITQAAQSAAGRTFGDLSRQIAEQMGALGLASSNARTGQLTRAAQNLAAQIGEEGLRAGVGAQEAATGRRLSALNPALVAGQVPLSAGQALGQLGLGAGGLGLQATQSAANTGLNLSQQLASGGFPGGGSPREGRFSPAVLPPSLEMLGNAAPVGPGQQALPTFARGTQPEETFLLQLADVLLRDPTSIANAPQVRPINTREERLNFARSQAPAGVVQRALKAGVSPQEFRKFGPAALGIPVDIDEGGLAARLREPGAGLAFQQLTQQSQSKLPQVLSTDPKQREKEQTALEAELGRIAELGAGAGLPLPLILQRMGFAAGTDRAQGPFGHSSTDDNYEILGVGGPELLLVGEEGPELVNVRPNEETERRLGTRARAQGTVPRRTAAAAGVAGEALMPPFSSATAQFPSIGLPEGSPFAGGPSVLPTPDVRGAQAGTPFGPLGPEGIQTPDLRKFLSDLFAQQAQEEDAAAGGGSFLESLGRGARSISDIAKVPGQIARAGVQAVRGAAGEAAGEVKRGFEAPERAARGRAKSRLRPTTLPAGLQRPSQVEPEEAEGEILVGGPPGELTPTEAATAPVTDPDIQALRDAQRREGLIRAATWLDPVGGPEKQARLAGLYANAIQDTDRARMAVGEKATRALQERQVMTGETVAQAQLEGALRARVAQEAASNRQSAMLARQLMQAGKANPAIDQLLTAYARIGAIKDGDLKEQGKAFIRFMLAQQGLQITDPGMLDSIVSFGAARPEVAPLEAGDVEAGTIGMTPDDLALLFGS